MHHSHFTFLFKYQNKNVNIKKKKALFLEALEKEINTFSHLKVSIFHNCYLLKRQDLPTSRNVKITFIQLNTAVLISSKPLTFLFCNRIPIVQYYNEDMLINKDAITLYMSSNLWNIQ